MKYAPSLRGRLVGLGIAAAALLALPSAAAAAPTLVITPSPDTVTVGGLVTYTATLTTSAGPPGILEERIDSMTDSVYGSLAVECGPFPRTVSYDLAVPTDRSRPLCSYARPARENAGRLLTHTVTATGAEQFTVPKPPSLFEPWTISGSGGIKVRKPRKPKCGRGLRAVWHQKASRWRCEPTHQS